MRPVSITQWQEEIKLFMEKTGDGRNSLFFLCLSLSDGLSPPFDVEPDLRSCPHKNPVVSSQHEVNPVFTWNSFTFFFSHIKYSCQSGFHCLLSNVQLHSSNTCSFCTASIPTADILFLEIMQQILIPMVCCRPKAHRFSFGVLNLFFLLCVVDQWSGNKKDISYHLCCAAAVNQIYSWSTFFSKLNLSCEFCEQQVFLRSEFYFYVCFSVLTGWFQAGKLFGNHTTIRK